MFQLFQVARFWYWKVPGIVLFLPSTIDVLLMFAPPFEHRPKVCKELTLATNPDNSIGPSWVHQKAQTADRAATRLTCCCVQLSETEMTFSRWWASARPGDDRQHVAMWTPCTLPSSSQQKLRNHWAARDGVTALSFDGGVKQGKQKICFFLHVLAPSEGQIFLTFSVVSHQSSQSVGRLLKVPIWMISKAVAASFVNWTSRGRVWVTNVIPAATVACRA